MIRSASQAQKTANEIRKWLSVRMAWICSRIVICLARPLALDCANIKMRRVNCQGRMANRTSVWRASLHVGSRSLLQRTHVDDEAVLHILLEHALEGFVDRLDGNDFDIGGDVVATAVVEHLLRLRHAADHGACDGGAPRD